MEHKTSRSKRRATSYDVASLAGVSQSAVSRCFKPGASISVKTREKVIAAATQLGYQPNAIARGLITQRSNMAAVIVSAQLNFYYPEVLFQLTEQLARHGIHVLLFTINEPADMDKALDGLWRYQVDGVISASYLSRSQYRLLKDRGIPTLLFNRFFSDVETNSVWCDPTAATQELIDFLVGQGHARFAMLEGPADSQVNMIRKSALKAALANHGLSFQCTAQGTYHYNSAAAATDSLLASSPSFTALICCNDMMAMGAIDRLRGQHSVDVPHDISVAGFDGVGAGQFSSYQLTTIRQPIARMAARAVDVLMEDVQGDAAIVQRLSLPGHLIVGASTDSTPS
ncbi:MAG: LacI family DNA-binding transcriptional regulator [Pseudomonadota bacterium]